MVDIYANIKGDLELQRQEARLREAKRKLNHEKRKAETTAKCMIGGTMHKYFPDAFKFSQDEWCRIESVIVKTKEFYVVILTIINEGRTRTYSPAEEIKKADDYVDEARYEPYPESSHSNEENSIKETYDPLRVH